MLQTIIDNASFILQLLPLVGTIIVFLLTFREKREVVQLSIEKAEADAKKTNAEAESILSGASLELYREIKAELDAVRSEFDEYREETDARITEQALIIAQQTERISALEKENQTLRAENNRLKSPKKRRGNL